MQWPSIRRYLRSYKIYGRQSTSVTYGFASAIAPRQRADNSEILDALGMLGQDPGNLSCVYCGEPAQCWDHLVPVVRAGKEFGPGHRIRNLVPCCNPCSGSKSNQDFDDWLPRSGRPGWEATIFRLRAYAAGIEADPQLPAAIAAETEAARERYWAIRDQIFALMHEADDIAGRIRALRHGNPAEPMRSNGHSSPGTQNGAYNPKPGTIGFLCLRLLAQGWPEAAILSEVRATFPGAKTGGNSLAWYKTKLRQMQDEQLARFNPA